MNPLQLFIWFGLTTAMIPLACGNSESYPPPPDVPDAVTTQQVLFQADFTSPLSAEWHIVREDTTGWSIEDGTFRVRSDPGDIVANDNNINMLLRDTPPPPFAVEVTIAFVPVEMYEQAGLVLYVDDNNYVKLQCEKMNPKPGVLGITFTHEKGRKFEIGSFLPFEAESFQLRFEHRGTFVIGYVRENDTAIWQGVGETMFPASENLQIGMVTGMGSSDVERWATYSNLRVISLQLNTPGNQQ